MKKPLPIPNTGLIIISSTDPARKMMKCRMIQPASHATKRKKNKERLIREFLLTRQGLDFRDVYILVHGSGRLLPREEKIFFCDYTEINLLLSKSNFGY